MRDLGGVGDQAFKSRTQEYFEKTLKLLDKEENRGINPLILMSKVCRRIVNDTDSRHYSPGNMGCQVFNGGVQN
jgi:hypothetical protein